ncbi:MAG: response regulator [Ginsengibacter sp.]
MAKSLWIVDDDHDTAELMEFILKGQGYTVDKFTQANNFHQHRNQLPDLYILDKWFDGVDGLQLCKELKTDPRTSHVPVLMVSAAYNIEELARTHCADGAIAKPFEIKTLVETVARVLSSSNAVSI